MNLIDLATNAANADKALATAVYSAIEDAFKAKYDRIDLGFGDHNSIEVYNVFIDGQTGNDANIDAAQDALDALLAPVKAANPNLSDIMYTYYDITSSLFFR